MVLRSTVEELKWKSQQVAVGVNAVLVAQFVMIGNVALAVEEVLVASITLRTAIVKETGIETAEITDAIEAVAIEIMTIGF